VSGVQVLVVEDDTGVGQLLELALRERGYSVARATTVLEALAMAHDVEPALVLLDLRLEGLDGRAFAAAYGGRGAFAVVVMTASQDAAAAAASIGAEGYLSKPFDLDALYELVERYVPSPT
jgi:two-component system response regulator (stage 0 sporulation protein F)